MQEQNDLIQKLNKSGKKLSKSHRKIAEYITGHYDKAICMTAATLGICAGVSESTVVRFAMALGYEGYPQMQCALQELVRHHLTSIQRIGMIDNLSQQDVLRKVLRTDMQNIRLTLEDIDNGVFDRIVTSIINAKSIYIMGLRSAAPLAEFLGYYLHYVFENVHVAGPAMDAYEQISRICDFDVMIGISFPRYSTRTLDAMKYAKSRQAKVIAITDGHMSPLAEIADECVTVHTGMTSFVDSFAAPMALINALVVAVGLRKKNELAEHFEMMEQIWAQNHTYLEHVK